MSDATLLDPVVLFGQPVTGADAGKRRRMTPLWLLRRTIEIAVVVVAVRFVLVPDLATSGLSWHLLSHVHRGWLALTLAGEVLSLGAFALVTHAMVPVHSRPRMHRILRIDLSSIAFSHSVPGGSPAAAALGLRLLNEAGVSKKDAAFAKFGQSIGSAVVLQMIMVIAVVARFDRGSHAGMLLPLLIVAVGVIVASIASVSVVRRCRVSAARRLGWVTTRVPRVADDLGERLVLGFADSIDVVFADRRRVARIMGCFGLNWLLDAVALWSAVHAFGPSVSYGSLVIPFCVASTLAWLPITPGGLGIVEGSLVPLLVTFGMGRNVAVLGVIFWRLVAFWLPIPLGALAYASLSMRNRREYSLPRPAGLSAVAPS